MKDKDKDTDDRTIPKAVAKKEFDRWAEAWDVDTAREHMDEDDRKGFDNMRHRIERAIMAGRLVVSEDGSVVEQALLGGDKNKIVYQIPTGAAWLTMDQHKEKQGMHKIFSYLAAMSKQPSRYFSNMDGRDIKVAQDIAVLFLG